MPDPLHVTRDDIVKGLKQLGVEPGALLMIHSSLSAIGHVEGGADTVVDALLEVLGPEGTLVVPTFTYPADYAESDDPAWIFDPVATPSAMGAITNAARWRPGARRSVHLWHSVAAIGPLAEMIASAGGDSAWDAESPMAWIMGHGGWLMLLGTSYQSLTAIHIFEVEFGVDYRREYDVERRLRQADGSAVPLISHVHDRVDSHPGSDFNRFGTRMEAEDRVSIGHVGNAISRLFRAGDAHEVACAMYAADAKAFLKQGDSITPNPYGRHHANLKGNQCVVDPERAYPTPSPGRPHDD
ncbi:MAG: hypothetical protein CMJ18_20520 [Phycisphaeraceae bacterium]|nr:hypothetical protein [Phycisphaeraceae bacterium]